MEILKRNKSKEPYERKKISRVIQKAFESVGTSLDEAILKNMVDRGQIIKLGGSLTTRYRAIQFGS